MKVSIVTPSFNQADFLEKTICSVLEQDYPHIEYLLVDGGSTDGSLEIIQKYSKQLTWWVSEPDSGQAEAINKGLSRVSGDIVAWLNSDDILLPGAIKQAVSIFTQFPETGLIYGDVLAIDARGTTTNRLTYSDMSLSDLAAFQMIGQPSVFMRRSVLEKAGYLDVSFHFLLDHHLWLRMAQLAKIRHIPEFLSAARFHADSKNVSRAAEFGQEAFRILDWMETQPILADILQKDHNRIKAGAHRLSAFYLLDGGDPFGSLREYTRCFKLNPGSIFRDWKHLIFAVLSVLGLDRLGGVYRNLRRSLIGRDLRNG
ncbi:glycosyltransferase family 2 protein [Chloroflexota bacterium]